MLFIKSFGNRMPCVKMAARWRLEHQGTKGVASAGKLIDFPRWVFLSVKDGGHDRGR